MTHRRRSILLVSACLALSLGLLAACGAEDEPAPSADEILRQTFRGGDPAIEDGYLSLSVRVDAEGSPAAYGPFIFTLLGPFGAPRAHGLERFDVELSATLAQKAYVARVLSTGRQLLVTLDDGVYEVDGALVERLRRSSRAPQGRARLPVTGFDPSRWISGAQRKRNERVAGVDATRIGGTVNVERLLGDLDGLFTKAASAAGATLFAPKLRRQFAAAVESSAIDIWTGASDRLLRQISVRFVFSFHNGVSPLPALTGGTFNLHLRLDDVNRRAAPASTFAAPNGTAARPLAAVTGASAADILKGIAAGLTERRGRGLFACLDAANASSSKLARCVAKLAP